MKQEEVGRNKEKRWVIYFTDLDKGLVCNKTNAKLIAKALNSDDTEEWVGKVIYLYSTEVEFGGDMVDGIRVRPRAPKAAPQPKSTDSDDDEIPF